MHDITALMADHTIQNMARDLHRQHIHEQDITDEHGRPLLAFTLETAHEYLEERGGALSATSGAIATAVLAVAYATDNATEAPRRGW